MLLDLNEKGQLFIISLIVMALVAVTTISLISGALTFKQNTNYSTNEVQAINLAEAGIDKAVASLNATAGNYNGDSDVQLDTGTFSVSITNIDALTKKITSTGFVPNKSSPKSQKTIEIQISKGTGVSFNYGVQVGEGGLDMSNNAAVNGSVYSNGNITLDNSSTITGDAYVAGGTQPSADQQNDCQDPNCLDFIFGKNVNGNNQLDVAQSFIPAQTAVVNKVSLKLKKFGSPPNITIRILGDSNGSPNKNDVKAAGTLSANLVTSQYGFVDIAFNTTPTLSSGTTYWIVADTSVNSSNYWAWHLDSLSGYGQGGPEWSPNWQSSNPAWNSFPGDLAFKIYMGGVSTYISGNNNARVNGSAHANTLQNLIIGSNAYYQVQTGLTVNGSTCTNNPNCHPGSSDPVPQPMPISDGNIQEWEQAAAAGGQQNGLTGCPSALPSKKIIGSISLTNGCQITIDAPIHITGNLLLDNGSKIFLNPQYGAASGVVVVDGTIRMSNNSKLFGSGTPGSYLLALSKYDSRQDGVLAIETDNGSSSMILYAPNGKVQLHNNASLKEVTSWRLILDNGASVTYETGLSGVFFSSGPGGTFSAIKGTYQIK